MEWLTSKEVYAVLLLFLTSSVICQAVKIEKLGQGNARFALDMYREIAANSEGDNIFFSPFSISSVLAMTYLGAKGSTAKEMKKVMSLNALKNKQLHTAFKKVSTILTKFTGSIKMNIANRLYAQKTYNFLRNYLKNTKKYYRAKVGKVDFLQDTVRATKDINRWVKQKTGGNIIDLIPQPLPATTQLVLVNAIYFQGNWDYEFDAKNTKQKFFWLNSKKKIKVDMMSHEETWIFNYLNRSDYHILELPYKGLEISMFIFLPHEKNGLAGVEQKLTSEDLLLEPYEDLMPRETNVWLPKFKLEEKVDLKHLLEPLGMKKMFSNDANFSGMDGTTNLHVSGGSHKCVIDVTEKGTTAAGASDVYLYFSSESAITVNFFADRPFMFMIRDNVAKAVLFLGRLTKP